MKKILLASSLFTMGLYSTTAFSADLPPAYTEPAFSWSGFYGGFNAGYAIDTKDFGDNTIDGVTYEKPKAGGFTGGGQIGFNYELTPGSGIVLGVETDAQYVDMSYKSTTTIQNGAQSDPRAPNNLDVFGTVRARIGYAFDRFLVYGTGGFAYGTGPATLDFAPVDGGISKGWTAGGGLEYALSTDSFFNFFNSSAVTLKAEALYVSVSRENFLRNMTAVTAPAFTVGGTTFSRSQSNKFVAARAGINYKFGTY